MWKIYTFKREIYKSIPNYYFSISTTTRALRGEEEDGVDYNFVSQEEFEKDIKDDKFLEYAKFIITIMELCYNQL